MLRLLRSSTGPAAPEQQRPEQQRPEQQRPERPLRRRNYTDEWVGLLVLLCLAGFLAAAFEAGLLHQWLQPPGRLRILLPQTGIGGLSPGADVEVFGIHAGTVRRLRLNPDGAMYAVADIDPQAEPFIRRDSKASIRLRYAVAGAAYVSLSRGNGAPMDWDYAVVPATTDQNPVDMLTATIQDIRTRIVPILGNAQDVTGSLKTILDDIRQGKGSAGRLLTDDTVIRQAEQTLATLQGTIAKLQPIENKAAATIGHADGVVGDLRAITTDLKAKTPAITQNATDATKELPALLLQARVTANELQKLLAQLRGLWFLGGSGTAKTNDHRVSPSEIEP